ncbi:MAG: hypothetical protein HYZ85_00745 [Candidatus Omnitrophica bacterium]|nr:hypothetical protein [Candidatus Omnitrophota bacterium]
MRPWIEGFFLFLFSFFLFTFALFSIFEGFPSLAEKLRLESIHYYRLKERYVPDPVLIFRRKPNYHYQGFFVGDHYGLFSDRKTKHIPYEARFDENGLRNASGHNAPHIGLIGDSFLEFGMDEADTLAKRLEKLTGLSVKNYGMEWYGPFQYLESFKRYVLPDRPQTVFILFFEGNDLRDMTHYLNWRAGGDYYHFNLTRKNLLERYLITLKDTGLYFLKLFLRSVDPRRVHILLPEGSEFNTILSYSVDLRPAEQIESSAEGRALKGILQEFKASAEKNGIDLVVVYIPTTAHIYAPYASSKSHVEWLSLQPEWIQNKSNQEACVRKMVEDSGMDWLSLTPAFEKAAASGSLLYYPTDTHWNEEGRKITASLLADHLLLRQRSAPS